MLVSRSQLSPFSSLVVPFLRATTPIMPRSSILLGIVSIMALAGSTLAFDITFPGPANYWVACGWNNMTWKSYTTDPKVVTIMLTNSDKHLLNDDFEIGNALQGSSNAAMVYIPCLPAASGYSLMFVNASSYDHKGKCRRPDIRTPCSVLTGSLDCVCFRSGESALHITSIHHQAKG